MNDIDILPPERYGYDFIPPQFLPPGKDEYWLRDLQQAALGQPVEHKKWRHLEPGEIEALIENGNRHPDWDDFFVSDPFDPGLIRNCDFYGRIRLGVLKKALIKHHDFCIPAGLRSSTIISCDIGEACAIQDCAYISHYIIGDHCILSRIDEMQTTNHAKFGNGAVKDGEEENVRVWIDVMNEAGGRSILPFAEIICADAFLWANYRDDVQLCERLKQITQEQYGGNRGAYGTVGQGTVIKSCKIIKDTAVGSHAYIKGANKLKNITICSSADEPCQIGEGVELVNGIIGYGCHIFYGSKAVRFVMGNRCNLKYGARLIHSVLGDNSTVSCCEILNNLIFPVHEQHHNNSFLIASLVQGMSNIAAAATIGSNHNSRANDGEIRAGRGFWPGLTVSLKHSSCFASFTIISKGSYPAELNISLPFSLINNNSYKNRLEVLPAYFWLYNLFALERNSWKSRTRDIRITKTQYIETDYLSPDTAEEIFSAIELLESRLKEAGIAGEETDYIAVQDMENSSRNQVILRPRKALSAYYQMLKFYAVKTLACFFDSRQELDFNGLRELLGNGGERVREWLNLGGQIVPAFKVDILREQIRVTKIKSWKEIHGVYETWQGEYPLDKARHAWAVLALLYSRETQPVLDAQAFRLELDGALKTRQWISCQILETRAKDFRNPFRKATFRNQAEMDQVVGSEESGSFIKTAREEELSFAQVLERAAARL
jgi:NDP-sugar pyrophosphorylase family protein